MSYSKVISQKINATTLNEKYEFELSVDNTEQMGNISRGLYYNLFSLEIGEILNSPPDTPTDGDTYIVGINPTGDWAYWDGIVVMYSSEIGWMRQGNLMI